MRAPAWCQSYIGTPYERADCWQLVRQVYHQELKIDLPAIVAPDGDDARRQAILDNRGEEWTQIPAGSEEEFDVAELALPVREDDRWRFMLLHLGIVVCRGLLLHTLPPNGAHVRRYGPANSMPERFWRWSG